MQQRTLMLPRALRPGRRVAAERWLPACAILALLALSGPAAASNLLVQTLPGWVSHASQGLAIAQECLRRGHNVTALFSTDDAQRLAARGLLPPALRVVAYRAPPDSLTQHAQLVEMMDDPRRISEILGASIQYYEGQFRALVADGEAQAALRQQPFDLTLVDALNVCGMYLADLLEVPRVDLMIHALMDPLWSRYYGVPHSPALHPFNGAGMAGHPLTFRERLANILVSQFIIPAIDLMTLSSSRTLLREFNLPVAYPSRAAVHRRARMLLLNDVAGLGGAPRSLPPHVKLVGPLLGSRSVAPLPAELEQVLEGAGPGGAVYASLGSAFKPHTCDIARGLAGALSAANRTVVWSVSAADFPGACPLDSLGLPPSVHVLPWVPQRDILGHPAVRVFLTHAGISSIHEALSHGVPVVCLPWWGDQKDTCAQAVRGGWGLHFPPMQLSQATAGPLAAAVDQVASEPSFSQSAARLAQLLSAHPRTPVEQAADWIEFAAALPDGVRLWDPAADMPWWQWTCLDVYAAVAAAAIAALAAAGLLMRAAWRAARRAASLWQRGRPKAD